MGVPVITLKGKRFIERLSSTMIAALNHDEWIATTKEDFVNKALCLAEDVELRAALRGRLRQEVMASPLYNGKDLSRSLEQAYRNMWRKYLSGE